MVSVALTQQRPPTTGKRGWKFWHLEQAPSSDPCKGLCHSEGWAWPEPLGHHRSYQELLKMLIKNAADKGVEKANARKTLKLAWVTFAAKHHLTSIAQNHGYQEISVALECFKGSPDLFFIHIALVFAQHLIFIFSDKMRAGIIMVYLNCSGTL